MPVVVNRHVAPTQTGQAIAARYPRLHPEAAAAMLRTFGIIDASPHATLSRGYAVLQGDIHRGNTIRARGGGFAIRFPSYSTFCRRLRYHLDLSRSSSAVAFRSRKASAAAFGADAA